MLPNGTASNNSRPRSRLAELQLACELACSVPFSPQRGLAGSLSLGLAQTLLIFQTSDQLTCCGRRDLFSTFWTRTGLAILLEVKDWASEGLHVPETMGNIYVYVCAWVVFQGGGTSLFMISEVTRSLRIFAVVSWRAMVTSRKLSPLGGTEQGGNEYHGQCALGSNLNGAILF